MKLNEFIKMIFDVPLKVTFTPDGTINFRKDTREFHEANGYKQTNTLKIDEYKHYSQLLKNINHGGLYGPSYADSYEINITRKSFKDQKITSYKFENVNEINQNLLDSDVNKILSIEVLIQTNSTGSVSYSKTIISIELKDN